jgi:hypothetical protein
MASADEAAQMYDPSTVYVIDLTLPKASVEELEKNPTEEYVEGTLTLRGTGGTPGTEGPPLINGKVVGIRLKGNKGGSFRDLKDKKAAFKIKCNFVSGKCLGLKKMTLNNMVQDPSMLHETLAYSAFRDAGVPASRTGFAYVRVNGEDFGLYLNLETLDDVFLKRVFLSFDDKVQHLYEGELGDDLVPGGEAGFEVDEGEEDRSDLEALIDAVNEGGVTPFSERVAPHAELAEMARMWAVEKYIEHWDGYAGHTELGQERPNNYYLYSEPSGRFQMLPWGTDQTWQPTALIPGREVTFGGPGGVLFNKCLEDKECFRVYWAKLNLATQTIPDLDPGPLAEDIADLLAPWQQEERDNGRPEPNADEVDEVDAGVEETLDFIAGRQAEAEAWLAENEPPVEASTASVSTSSRPSPNVIPVPDVVPGRFAVANGVLVSRIWVSGAGAVGQRVSISTRRGRLRVCTADEKTQQAGPVTLRCKLSDAARRRLRKKPLRLKAYTTFVPLGRAGIATVRNLTAPRDPSL